MIVTLFWSLACAKACSWRSLYKGVINNDEVVFITWYITSEQDILIQWPDAIIYAELTLNQWVVSEPNYTVIENPFREKILADLL